MKMWLVVRTQEMGNVRWHPVNRVGVLESRILGVAPLTICQMAYSIGVMSSRLAHCMHGEGRLEECT